MSGQRQQWDLLSNWATGKLCEAQAAHRGSEMGDLGLPSPPAEVKLGVEPGWGGCVIAGEVWHGPKRVASWLCLDLATGLHGWLWSSPAYIIGVLSASDFNNGIFLLQCGE